MQLQVHADTVERGKKTPLLDESHVKNVEILCFKNCYRGIPSYSTECFLLGVRKGI
jgi:hypothetical protein